MHSYWILWRGEDGANHVELVEEATSADNAIVIGFHRHPDARHIRIY